MNKALYILLLLFCAAFSSGTVLVTVSPSPVTVNSAGTQQFTSTITGAAKGANLTVSWTASAGSINSSGFYTAPSVAIRTAVTVRATRVTHGSQFGDAVVTITPLVATQHSVGLTWNPVSGAAGYSVYRGTVSGGPYALLASAIATASFTDTTVVSGQTYYFVVTDSDLTGQESTYSNEVPAVVPQ